MINELKIRKWHRTIGIILAPLILLQAFSGMVIAFELLLGIHEDVSDLLKKQESHTLHHAWDYTLLDIHYGGGYLGDIYHLVLVMGLISLITTGIMVFLKAKMRQAKNRPSKVL